MRYDICSGGGEGGWGGVERNRMSRKLKRNTESIGTIWEDESNHDKMLNRVDAQTNE